MSEVISCNTALHGGPVCLHLACGPCITTSDGYGYHVLMLAHTQQLVGHSCVSKELV